jgi:hypothetical protein
MKYKRKRKKETNFSHKDLVKIAENWLLKRCGFAFSELTTFAGETPDGIGFRSDGTILVECKCSRSDFLADKKKLHRIHPWMGVGKYRFFMCEKGLIKPDELPEKWGLLYVNNKGQVRQKVGPSGNIWSSSKEFVFDRDIKKEMSLMYSALRRLHLQGVMPLIYEKYKNFSKKESK